MCIPIIFIVEAVNSQNEDCVGAARRGGVYPAIIPGKRMGRSSRAIPGSENAGFSECTSRRVERRRGDGGWSSKDRRGASPRLSCLLTADGQRLRLAPDRGSCHEVERAEQRGAARELVRPA